MKCARLLLCSTVLVGAVITALAASAGAQAREIDITLKRWGVDPARIEVTQGEAVKLTVKSSDSVHGFEIKKLKINKEVPKSGKPIVVEFVASTAGEFEITCSEYCGKGHKEMKGLLVVKPKS